MNTEAPSVVANRMYAFGETYAQAKAWAVANFGVAGADVDNVQADITTLGGQALSSRAIAWYDRNSLFADVPTSSPNPQPVPGLNLAGNDGSVVEVKNGAFTLGTISAGGLTGVGAFGSTPNANGASVSGSNLVLQPADATHPGLVAAADQNFGTFTRTFAGIELKGSSGFGAYPGVSLAANHGMYLVGGTGVTLRTDDGNISFYQGGNTYIFGPASMDMGSGLGITHSIVAGWGAALTLDSVTFVGQDNSSPKHLLLNCDNAPVEVRTGGSVRATFNTGNLDLTGTGVGGSIKLKSPDGTVYTMSIANGGTLSIV